MEDGIGVVAAALDQFEDRAPVACAAIYRGAEEIATGVRDQAGVGLAPLATLPGKA